MDKLIKELKKILKDDIAVEKVVMIVEEYKPLRKVTASSLSIKSRGIMASVALKAAVELLPQISDKTFEELADVCYVWLRTKQEVGMPKEIQKAVEAIEPF